MCTGYRRQPSTSGHYPDPVKGIRHDGYHHNGGLDGIFFHDSVLCLVSENSSSRTVVTALYDHAFLNSTFLLARDVSFGFDLMRALSQPN